MSKTTADTAEATLHEARRKALKPKFDAIPGELKELKQWVIWRYELSSDGKLTKVPYQPAQPGSRANHSDPATWSSFDDAARIYREDGTFDGVMFALSLEDRYTLIDLDDSLNPDWSTFAKDVVNEIKSYTEISTSGTGLHIIGVGVLDDNLGHKRHDIEMYNHSRFAIMTGHVYEYAGYTEIDPKCAGRVRDLQCDIFEIGGWYNPEFTYERDTSPLSDEDKDLLERFFTFTDGDKWRDVYNGKGHHYYRSLSEADLALCNKLAWLFQYDMKRVDRVFRHSKLMRPKWDKRHHSNGDTHGARTLSKALADHVPGKEGYGVKTAEEWFVLTEAGNAERLVHLFGEYFKYVKGLDFMVYDGKVWKQDANKMTAFALESIRTLHNVIEDLTKQLTSNGLSDKEREDIAAQIAAVQRHIKSGESARGLAAAVGLTKALPGVVLDINKLDHDPMLLNVQNGVVDLKTGALLDHRPEDYLTQITPIDYDSSAKCPRWEQFQAEIACVDGKDDPAMVEFKQRLWGYTLTGDASERKLMLGYGFGANGKSTEIEAMKYVMGSYAKTTPFTTFTAKDRGGIPNDLAALRGARFVSASEGDVGARLSEGVVKNLTGNENFSARFLRKEFFEFKPVCKIWLLSNHKPNIVGQDDGIWDRLVPLNYATRFAQDKRENHLDKTLRSEAKGILAWAVRGCLAWQKKGLDQPKRVTADHSSYKRQMDTLGDFLEDRFTDDPKGKVDSKELQAHFKEFCAANNFIMSYKTLQQALLERGYEQKKSNGVRWWTGLKEKYRLN